MIQRSEDGQITSRSCVLCTTAPHSSTGYSPYFLYFEVEPTLPINNLLGLSSKQKYNCLNEWVKNRSSKV